MYSKTLTEEVCITGKPYSNFPKVEQIILVPAKAGTGYQFHVGDETIPYDLAHLSGVQQRGARFNVLSSESHGCLRTRHAIHINVVEHLVSALSLSGITDVHIHFDLPSKRSFFVPTVGPGVAGILDAVEGKMVEIRDSRDKHSSSRLSAHLAPELFYSSDKHWQDGPYSVTVDLDQHSVSYIQYDKGIRRSLTLTPSERSLVQVQQAQQTDVLPLGEQPYSADLTQLDSDDLRARPLARVSRATTNMLLGVMNTLGLCKGITPETYFFAKPGYSAERIVQQMWQKFQPTHNEHLAHTAVADFPGELHALACSLGVHDLHLKATLSNTNHPFGVATLKQILKDQILTI